MPSTTTSAAVNNHYNALAATRPELEKLLVIWNKNATPADNEIISGLMTQVTGLVQAGAFGDDKTPGSFQHLAHAFLICVTAWSDSKCSKT